MAYRALYREYRPVRFSDVIGQEHITETLKNQIITGRVIHAYLFSGPRGTGKTSTAQIFARALNCEHPVDGEPCGQCEACRYFSSSNIDVYEIDAASNSRVEEMRELLDKVDYAPARFRYRIYILDEVHMLSQSAFNALLKTLEEPPPHAIFILATTELHRLPATIVSRCQRHAFRRIPAGLIADEVKKITEKAGAKFDKESLMLIARAAMGGMRDALSLADQCIAFCGDTVTGRDARELLGYMGEDNMLDTCRALLSGDGERAMSALNDAWLMGTDIPSFLRQLTAALRDIMIAASSGDAAKILDTTEEHAETLRNIAEEHSIEAIMRALDILLPLDQQMRLTNDPRTALELAMLRICSPEGETDYSAICARLDAIEAGVNMRDIERRLSLLEEGRPAKKAAPAAKPAEAKPASEPKKPPVNKKPSEGAEVYEQLKDYIKRNCISLFAPLRRGKFGGISGDTFKILFDDPSTEVFADILSQEKNLDILAKAIEEITGNTLKPVAVKAAPQPEEFDSGDIESIFGKENISYIE